MVPPVRRRPPRPHLQGARGGVPTVSIWFVPHLITWIAAHFPPADAAFWTVLDADGLYPGCCDKRSPLPMVSAWLFVTSVVRGCAAPRYLCSSARIYPPSRRIIIKHEFVKPAAFIGSRAMAHLRFAPGRLPGERLFPGGRRAPHIIMAVRRHSGSPLSLPAPRAVSPVAESRPRFTPVPPASSTSRPRSPGYTGPS